MNTKVSSLNSKLLASYMALLVIPFLATFSLDMDYKGLYVCMSVCLYVSILGMLNVIAMMAFFVQFPLGSRVRKLAMFANIDWSMAKHKSVGQWIGVFFLLHSLLILAPRFQQAFTDGITSVVEVVTSPQMLMGLIAWVTMVVWVLMAVFKNKLKMSYEMWRLTHVIGFVVIAVLATLHITSVGSHGQFEAQFNTMWWALCSVSIALVIYNYFIKKLSINAKPFTLVNVEKVSSSDWQITLENTSGASFEFDAGQFVWMNTSASAFNMNEHPFSIASCKKELPQMSMIIRELGDYTSSLDSLKVGQDVFVDGPYGSLSLSESDKSDAIVLIAGGAGIGPMLSLLRELASRNEQRPVRLIYGNGRYDQMVLQDQIRLLENSMPNFKQKLACVESTESSDVYHGVIDQSCIGNVLYDANANNWTVYLCGPEAMISGVKKSLKALKVPASNIHYEQLSF
ncbi:ferric reductase-like transmembrane domain-containing protein [Vibrio hannami]|uniref:ferredoxin reductase family protein n=1 Tax=Vibrio hannami TaxID=2717094 RepID=UPI0024107F72|nr:ferric reductase-like transmembrane domain-containing protein [Vibrio hannami]MDG3085716.1 ferric reductase-like transmembrane domain-containing protein [Vibrio hannami]